MHDLLRRHAHELCLRNIPEGEQRACLTRLLDHYVAVGGAAADRQFPLSRSARLAGQPGRPKAAVGPALPDVAAAATWLAAERANLVRACLHAAEHGWPRHAVALALVLRPVLDGGHDEDARAVHSAALAAAEHLAADCGDADRAIIRTGLGIANWRLGRHPEAIEALRLALDEHERAGNGGGAVLTMAAFGLVYDAQGRYREAIESQRRGLRVARAAGVRVQEAIQLVNVAFGHLRLEEYELAADQYRQAYEIFDSSGERIGRAHAQAGLAASLEGLGDYDTALAEAQEAVATYRLFDQIVYRLRAMATIGSIHRRMAQTVDALELLTVALRECRDLDHPRPTANVLNTLGDTYLDVKDQQRALASHAEALALADRSGDRWERSRALVGLGDAHARAGDLSLARGYWRQARDAYADADLPAARRVRARLHQIDAS
jgi:tetratricopeptide (TPR) repeat protein